MGTFDISKFKSMVEAAGGFTRGSYFQCIIYTTPSPITPVKPTTAFNIGKGFEENIVVVGSNEDRRMLCRAVELPAAAITPVELRYFTRPVKLPGAREYGPLSLTFFNTANYGVRSFFEQWQGRLSSYHTNARGVLDSLPLGGNIQTGSAPNTIDDSWFKTITLTPMNIAGDALGMYTFHNAFPTNISGMQFSHDNDAEAQTYTVQFEYLDMIFTPIPLPTKMSIVELATAVSESIVDTADPNFALNMAMEMDSEYAKLKSEITRPERLNPSRWAGAAVSILSLLTDTILDGRTHNDKEAWDALFRKITAPDPTGIPPVGGGGLNRIPFPIPK